MSLAQKRNGARKKIPQINGDVLEFLDASIDWDAFVPELNAAIPRRINRRGGRPPFNNLLMFKILIVKWLFKLSYDQTERLISEHPSLKGFLGFDKNDFAPDAKTIWLYKDILSKSGSVPILADMLDQVFFQNRYEGDDLQLQLSGAAFIDGFDNKSAADEVEFDRELAGAAK